MPKDPPGSSPVRNVLAERRRQRATDPLYQHIWDNPELYDELAASETELSPPRKEIGDLLFPDVSPEDLETDRLRRKARELAEEVHAMTVSRGPRRGVRFMDGGREVDAVPMDAIPSAPPERGVRFSGGGGEGRLESMWRDTLPGPLQHDPTRHSLEAMNVLTGEDLTRRSTGIYAPPPDVPSHPGNRPETYPEYDLTSHTGEYEEGSMVRAEGNARQEIDRIRRRRAIQRAKNTTSPPVSMREEPR